MSVEDTCEVRGRGNAAHRRGGPWCQPITVWTTTLADIFRDHGIDRCDLLKLDCEGAEYRILYSAPRDVLDRIDHIILEYHHFSQEEGANPSALRTFLEGRGFVVRDHRKHMF